MKKNLVMLVAAVMMLAVAIAPVGAQQGNIVETAANAGQFNTLLAAATAAGLADTLANGGPFTVFAPTDGAFQTLLNELGVTAEQLLADTDLLTSVLLYHVVSGEVKAADIVSRDVPFTVETLNGASLTVNFNGQVVLDNGRAAVIAADVDASNGVIHVINNVLLPSAASAPAATTTTTAGQPSIAGIVASTNDFSTLLAAAQAAGLVDTLANGGPFTVFAPTNGAFATLLSDLGVTAEQLLADTDLLTTVLLYHVVPGEFKAADVLALGLPTTVPTAAGPELAIGVDADSGRVLLNNGQATVAITDVDASNGVIHVIDNVLLPPQ